MIRAWLSRIGNIFDKRHRDRELSEELESHLAFHIDENIRRGMSPQEARRQALLKLGGMDQTKEAYRDHRGMPWFDSLIQDIRFGLRMLGKNRGFSAAAVLTLALGIGINAGIFSILDALTLRPITAGARASLVSVYPIFQGRVSRHVMNSINLFSYPEYREVRDGSTVFAALAAYVPQMTATMEGETSTNLHGSLVTCNYFGTLDVKPALGRGFVDSDCASAGINAVIIVSNNFWQTKLAANPAAVGTTIILNRSIFRIVGVAPSGFAGTEIVPDEFWAPITMQTALMPEGKHLDEADLSWMAVLGRLEPGISEDRARADLTVVANRISQQHSEDMNISLQQASLVNDPQLRKATFAGAAVLLTAVAFILLIACANIANMLLARATARRKEIAVRLALGAGRIRLIRQLLTESVLLALIGGAIGTWLSFRSFDVLMGAAIKQFPGNVPPPALHLGPDSRVILFSLLLTLGTGIAFGLAPALQSSDLDVNASLKEGGGDATTQGARVGTLRNLLVGGQVAVCLVLLLTAGLLLRGLYRAQTIDPGFEMQHTEAVTVHLSTQGYTDAQALAMHRQIRARLSALPGLEELSEALAVPLSNVHHAASVQISGASYERAVSFNRISANFFAMFGIPIVRGRAFTDADIQSGERVAIVTEATARAFWPGEDPIGKTFQMLLDPTQMTLFEVIGVATNAEVDRLGETSNYIYLPAIVGQESEQQFMVHTRIGDATALEEIRTAMRGIDPGLSFDARSMTQNLELFRAPSRIAASASTALGVLALLLASIGIYGLVSYGASQRRREIGIRIALGAGRRDVMELVFAQALRPVVIGVAIGIVCSAGVARIFSNLLFGVSAFDPLSFTLVPMVLLAVAVLACYLPARRATRVDPMVALRHE